jgi:TP901 family phage tail tape measure protein
MPTKSIKLALMTTGADGALASLTKLAEKKDTLAKRTNITLTLDDANLTEEKLNLIGDRVKTLTAEGANVRVNLIGAGVAEAQLGVLADEQKKLVESGAAVSASFKEQAVASEGFGAKASKSLAYAALGVAAVGGLSIKMAGDFDASTTRLVTGGGEAASALNSVRAGILGISASTATSAAELSTAMYLIESAGFHGANGLNILKAASEGAKAEGANLADVANAVTSALNSYHLPASAAVSVTDQLVKSVSEGKMTMEQLAGSIHSVLPVAAAAGLSLAQVGGAIATMTMQGMSAQQATQDLAHTILSLQNPNNVAVAEMEQFGLKANDVSKNLGTRGLTGTISLLEGTILKNMGPSGDVLLKSFNQSKDAANDLNIMMKAMPAPVEKLAKEYMAGSLSLSAFHKAVPTDDAGMVKQFTTLYNKVHGFNTALRAGSPASQTFVAALSKIMGGQTGLNTALMVGGKNMPAFEANVAGVAQAAKSAGKNVTDWSIIQSGFNFKLAQTKDSAKAVAISFGNALMPAVLAIIKPIASFGVFLANNAIASKAFAAILVGVLAAALGTKLVQGFQAVGNAGKAVVGMFTEQAGAAAADAAATDTATVATKGFMLALLTNPITLIIAGLVLLGVGIYELIVHCKAFRDFWIDLWKDVQVIASDVWVWLKSTWQSVVGVFSGIGDIFRPFTAAADSVIATFDRIKSFVTSSFDAWWKTNGAALKEVWSGIWTAIRDVFMPIWNTIVSVAKIGWSILSTLFTFELSELKLAWSLTWTVISTVFKIAWDVISGIAKAYLLILRTEFDIGILAITALWRIGWAVVSAVVQVAWLAVRTLLKIGWDLIVGIFTVAIDLLTGRWGAAWATIRTTSQQIWNAIYTYFKGALSIFSNAFSTILSAIVGFFSGLGRRILGALGDFASLLVSTGKSIIEGLYGGLKNAISDVGNWIKNNLVDPVVNAVKNFFGIHSPSSVMAGLGGHLVSGLFLGILKTNPTAMISKIFGSLPSALGSIVEKGLVSISKLPGKALSALAGLGGKLLSILGIGGKGAAANVAGWLEAALAVTGKPQSWLDPLEILVGKESGGNPSAYNPISVMGEHATGLLQMLPTTFAANELPGFGNILNPLDNAISSIRYISAQYGSPMNIPGISGGPYVGYDQGGILTPGFHMVANLSGKNEQVIPAGGGVGGGGGSGVTVNIYAHPSNNPDEIYEQVWQGLRNLRRHKGNQPLGLG